MSFFLGGFVASKTTKKTNTLSRKPNKINKTEVKPKSIVFQVKPSFLFQKFLFSSGIPCLSVEDLNRSIENGFFKEKMHFVKKDGIFERQEDARRSCP